MAFEGLADKLSQAFKNLKRKGRLSEGDVKTAMREIKLALLEADVSYKVVKEFVNNVSARCVGSDVLESLTPSQQVIKIVNEELTSIMGSQVSKIKISSAPPTIIMMVGLQGTGKTTHCGKLANYFKKQGKRPLLVACDVYRPAAISQLCIVGESVDVPVFKIDEQLMDELNNIKAKINPTEILLVVDSMTGQDAVNVAEKFNELLDIDGVVLTKLDGDTRGGAALSVKHITGKPIKFAGIGEKMEDIEPFYPDRMASRILGMGDVLTLIDKAQAAFDEKQAAELEEKMRKNKFTLTDYLEQMKQIKQMGPLENLIGMIPGAGKALKGATVDEKAIAHFEAIILSMTPGEREDPSVINASRRRRIAAGSGRSVEEVNRLLRQFEQMNKLFKQLNSKKKNKNFLRGFGI